MEGTINLRKKREFGEIFNAVFLFIKQEYKLMGQVFLTVVMPVLIVTAIANAFFQWNMLKNMPTLGDTGLAGFYSSFLPGYLAIYLLTIINQVLLVSASYGYMALYLEKGRGNFTAGDVIARVKSNFFPLFLAGFVMFLMVIAGTFLCLLPGIYLAISLSLVGSVIVFEKKGLGSAITRSFELSHMDWWWTLLLVFVTVMMVAIIGYFITLPASIGTIGAMLHNLKDPAAMTESISTFTVVYTAITTLVISVLYVIPVIAIGLQYFNLLEIKENPSLMEKIQQISNEPQQN